MVDAQAAPLRLRDSLKISARKFADLPCYVIEDPLTSRFFRVGAREYEFIIRLQHGIETALTEANATTDGAPLDAAQASEIVRWLATEGLLEGAADLPKIAVPANRGRWLNPIILRIPLINPDRWLSRHIDQLRWLLGGPFALLWGMAVISALFVVGAEWPRLIEASAGVFYPANWIALIIVWIAVKVVHELFHGLVCKHYGGNVFEAGVILILFLPVGYVDATSSWRFTAKRQRIHVALAGMYIELFFAAVAVWVWLFATAGIVSQLAVNTFMVAGVTTVFFNANPLMRFDGYFALADAVDIPNLFAAGRRYVGACLKKIVLGIDSGRELGRSWRDAFVRVYGLASALWRVVVIATLLIVAAQLFHGAGLALAVLAAVTMLRGSWRQIRPQLVALGVRQRWNAAGRLAALVAVLAAVAYSATWNQHIRVAAMVKYSGAEVVRAETAGFVVDVAVESGQRLTVGERVARLENAELSLSRKLAAIDLRRSRLRMRALRNDHELAAAAGEASRATQLERELADLDRQLATLDIAAPRAGIVVDSDPGALLGTYVPRGGALLSIVDTNSKRVHVALPESVAGGLSVQAARVDFPGRKPLVVELSEASPRARREVRDPELTATHGGPLAVRSVPTPGSAGGGSRLEYLEAHFDWSGELDPVASRAVRAGEIGVGHLRGAEITMTDWATAKFDRWLRHLLERRENAG